MDHLDELMEWMHATFPDAIMEESDGEIMIHAGMACTQEDRLVLITEIVAQVDC